MKNTGFSYEFSTKELLYFLFANKKCPNCGGMMTKNKGFELVEGKELNSKTDSIFGANTLVKSYQYYFNCQHCGNKYTLNELANKKIAKKG